MKSDTITLARHATTMDRPEPTVMIWQPDEDALAAARTAAADRGLGHGAAMRGDPGQGSELARLGDQIAELSARIDAATYELLCQLREFDRGYGWEGWRSCAHWLNWRTGLDLGAAREKLRVAAALADLNHIAAAMARGQLSYSKVRALTRVATPATEAPLLAFALRATASHVERLVRAWRQADRDAQPDAAQMLLASRALSMRVDDDGMVTLRGRLPPEVGAVLMRAVEAALEQVPALADGDDPTIAQRRADALGLVAESALAGGLDPGNSADRFQVTVHVQADTLTAREVDGEAQRVAAESRAASTAAAEPHFTAADAVPRVAAESRLASTVPSVPPAAAADAPPHVAAESRLASTVPSEPPAAAADAPPHVAAETRLASTVPSEPPAAAADAPPHVAAETRLASSVSSEPPAAAADAPPHVAAETRLASSAPSELPAAAADGATASWQVTHPDGNAVSGIASAAGRPLGDPRSRNRHGKLSPSRDWSARCPREAKGHEGQEGRRAGSAARSPLRDESAGYGGGATDPSTPGPATVAAARTSAEPLQATAAAREWAAPDTDRDAGLAVIEQAGGLHLGREAARRVACDAGLVVLRHGAAGEVLDVGRRTRTVPSALRRALQSRDHGQCQFPGCDSRRCDAHHVEHWADGGETRLQNLLSLCRFHHRAVHEQGFQVVAGDTDGQFRFLRPDGEPLPAEPPVSSWQGAPLAPTGARLAAAGINIGPHTATPDWYGESLNLTAALDVLWEPPAASAPGSS